MDDLSVNPEYIVANSQLIDDMRTSSSDIWNTLNDRLSGLGDFAGDDQVGESFYSQWKPGIQSVGDLMVGFSHSLGQDVDNTANTGSLYQKADDVNTELSGNLLD
jgi:hypothetical protein